MNLWQIEEYLTILLNIYIFNVNKLVFYDKK